MQEVPPPEEPTPNDEPGDDQPSLAAPQDEEAQDEFGINYSTEYQIVEYDNWNRVLERTVTYAAMDDQDRAAVRKLRKYEQPSSAAGTVASRRDDALRGVVDDAQVTLQRGEGWDDEDAAAEGGLLGQFEGDMMDASDGDEASLSDGVGTPETQVHELGDSAVGPMEDDDDVIDAGLDGGDDDEEAAGELDDEEADELGRLEDSADALDEDPAELLEDGVCAYNCLL